MIRPIGHLRANLFLHSDPPCVLAGPGSLDFHNYVFCPDSADFCASSDMASATATVAYHVLAGWAVPETLERLARILLGSASTSAVDAELQALEPCLLIPDDDFVYGAAFHSRDGYVDIFAVDVSRAVKSLYSPGPPGGPEKRLLRLGDLLSGRLGRYVYVLGYSRRAEEALEAYRSAFASYNPGWVAAAAVAGRGVEFLSVICSLPGCDAEVCAAVGMSKLCRRGRRRH